MVNERRPSRMGGRKADYTDSEEVMLAARGLSALSDAKSGQYGAPWTLKSLFTLLLCTLVSIESTIYETDVVI